METTPQLHSPNPQDHVEGIVKQWDAKRKFGIIYGTRGQRYFLHKSKVISGTPVLGSRVTFAVGGRRSPVDLQDAINVVIGETVGAE